MIPPSLRGAGDKLDDGVWSRWLSERPPRRRNWLTIRMPAFHLPPSEAAALRSWFVRRERIPGELARRTSTRMRPPSEPIKTETQTEPQTDVQRSQLLEAAGLLVGSRGFGCLSCHAIGDVHPAQSSLTAIGPSLSQADQYLRPTWFRRWVHQPGRILPNIEMPAVQQPVREILSGDLDHQLGAIWWALNQPDFAPPASNVVRVVAQNGAPGIAHRSLLLTDCLQLPGDMLLRPALCALPNQHNVLIDLGSGRLVGWWAGPAAQQRTAGKSWFWEPLATTYIISTGPAWELTIPTDAALLAPGRNGQFVTGLERWSATRNAGLQLRYRLQLAPQGRPLPAAQAPGPFPEPLDVATPDNVSLELSGDERISVLSISVDQELVPLWAASALDAEPADESPTAADTTSDQPSDQEFDDTTVESLRGGFERAIQLTPAPAWPAHEIRWYVAPQSSRLVVLGPRELMWPASRATVELVEPANAEFRKDERGDYLRCATQADGHAPVRIVLRYRTAQPAAAPIHTEFSEQRDAADPVTAVPGFRGFRLPLDRRWMPTALAWDPQGTLYVTSLKGRVWRATDTDGDGREDRAVPISDELAAPYGIVARGEFLDVINKYALLRLRDSDKDGFFESGETLAAGWGHTADYHDWTVGLVPDGKNGYYVATACQQDERPPAAAQWRGRLLRLTPRPETEASNQPMHVQVVSAGHRFPMGLVLCDDGSLLVTDNQGNFNPFNELNHVRPGRHYGFFNRWELDRGIQHDSWPPAVSLPHPWTRSVNGIAWLKPPSPAHESGSRGKLFGPWAGQLVGCEYDTRRLVRMSVETVGGELQGAAYPMSEPQAPPATGFLGPLCCAVSPAGELYVGGIRDSGWGGGNNVGELVRLEWDPDGIPDGIAEMTIVDRGFRCRFNRPIAADWISNVATYGIESFYRRATPAYGGDDQDRRQEPVERVVVEDGRSTVRLELPELEAGRVYEIRVLAPPQVRFFPAEAYYTVHRRPGTK
jgi:hypothetical protein